MRVDQVADLVDVAFGQDAAVVDQQDVRRHRLDLVEDVARDDDVLAGARPVLDEPNGLAAHQRIHPGERLVEDQQFRIVDERLRQLDALPHALAVGADLLVRGVHQIDALNRAFRRGIRVAVVEAVEAHQRGDPLEAGHALVKRVLLGTKPDPIVERRVSPDRLAQHANRALARLELAGHQFHERRLARTVRPEQSSDARRNRDGHVVQAAHLPVPLRHAFGLHQRHNGTRLPAPG